MKLIVLFILATLIIVAPLGNAFSESDAEGHSSSIITAPSENVALESDVERYSRSDDIYAESAKSLSDKSYSNSWVWSIQPDYNPYTFEHEARSPTRNSRYSYKRNYQRLWK